jgi:hypothetical protein
MVRAIPAAVAWAKSASRLRVGAADGAEGGGVIPASPSIRAVRRVMMVAVAELMPSRAPTIWAGRSRCSRKRRARTWSRTLIRDVGPPLLFFGGQPRTAWRFSLRTDGRGC